MTSSNQHRMDRVLRAIGWTIVAMAAWWITTRVFAGHKDGPEFTAYNRCMSDRLGEWKKLGIANIPDSIYGRAIEACEPFYPQLGTRAGDSARGLPYEGDSR